MDGYYLASALARVKFLFISGSDMVYTWIWHLPLPRLRAQASGIQGLFPSQPLKRRRGVERAGSWSPPIPRTLHRRRGWPMKRKEESEHIRLFAGGGGPSVFRIFGPLPTQESVPRHPFSCIRTASPCNVISSIPNSNILVRRLILTFVASKTRFPRLNLISARPPLSSRDSPNLSSRLRHYLETRRASHELSIRQPLPR